jgi:large subunit ribosomal protein L3
MEMIRGVTQSRSLNGLVHFQKRFIQRPAINTSQLDSERRTGALAMKVGMIPLWDKWGSRFATTVLQLDECEVVQVKTNANEGYTAVHLGVGEAKLKRVNKPDLGHYKKADVKPKRKLMEFRVTEDALLPVGTQIKAMHFVPGQMIDVCGISKGKGFQGVMKRWNFRGGFASHGASVSHRIPGSTGCRQDPGRVFKNKKMAGHMGSERVTIQNLEILKIDPARDLIYVKGAVPGNNGVFVRIVDAVKGPFFPSPPPFPTFVPSTDFDASQPLFAPVPEKDVHNKKEPDDAL